METRHFEKIRFLSLEQVQEVFEDSLNSLREFRDANDLLSATSTRNGASAATVQKY